MARPKRIRITKNDVGEYKRLVKNTKAKISRTLKNYGIDLSSEINIPSLEDFKTRKQFNKFKEEVRSFTNRNNTAYQFVKNKYGVVISKKELNKIKRDSKLAQTQAKKVQNKAAKLPFIADGEVVSTVGQRSQLMGKPNTGGITIPKDFNFDTIQSNYQLDKKKKNLEDRSKPDFFNKRAELLKENYIKAIRENYNSLGDELIEEIKDVDANDFFELFIQHDDLQFEYVYTEEQNEESLEEKMNVIERYKRGEISMDLKGF